MIRIDRRTAIRGGVASLAALAIPARLLAAGSLPALFIFDSRMPGSGQLANAWRAQGVPVLDRMAVDLGHAWRGEIADRLRQGGGAIAGLTLWMDSYICETFGRDFGMTLEREPAGAAAPWQQWRLQMFRPVRIG